MNVVLSVFLDSHKIPSVSPQHFYSVFHNNLISSADTGLFMMRNPHTLTFVYVFTMA